MEFKMASILNTLQTQVVARLDAQTFFSAAPAITVLEHRAHDLLNRVQQTLGKLGICVIVGTPQARQDTPSKHSPPHFSRISVVCSIWENVIINRAASGSGQPGDLVAEAVAYYLTGWAPAILGNALLIEGIEPIQDDQYNRFEVTHFTGGAITEPTRQT